MTNLYVPAGADDRPDVPRAISDLAARLGVKPGVAGLPVTLKQAGRMKQSIETERWTAFTATQTISSRACAFNWRARMGPLGAISVQDAFADGAGVLSVKAFGLIPIARAAPSAALTRGELMRYLAELPWAPDAVVANPALRWREVSADTIAVSAGAGETAAEVFFTLDSDGRIAGGYAPDRPRSTTAPFLPTRWPFRFSDYREHAGRWIPFAGESLGKLTGVKSSTGKAGLQIGARRRSVAS